MIPRWLKGLFRPKSRGVDGPTNDQKKIGSDPGPATPSTDPTSTPSIHLIELLRSLSQPHTTEQRRKAIAVALKAGMSFGEIEQILDWLDHDQK